MNEDGRLLVAASQPPPGSHPAAWFALSGLFLLVALFFIATAFSPTLHRWMLKDDLGNGKKLPPGYREFMTRQALKFGVFLVLFAVGLAIVGVET